MTFTPTNRPVPSDAPEDLYFNSSTLDALVNGATPTVPDRNGVPRKTWAYIEGAVEGPIADLQERVGDLEDFNAQLQDNGLPLIGNGNGGTLANSLSTINSNIGSVAEGLASKDEAPLTDPSAIVQTASTANRADPNVSDPNLTTVAAQLHRIYNTGTGALAPQSPSTLGSFAVTRKYNVTAGSTYTLSIHGAPLGFVIYFSASPFLGFYNSDGSFNSQLTSGFTRGPGDRSVTFTVPAGASKVAFNLRNPTDFSNSIPMTETALSACLNNIMLNIGSTALSFTPYSDGSYNPSTSMFTPVAVGEVDLSVQGEYIYLRSACQQSTDKDVVWRLRYNYPANYFRTDSRTGVVDFYGIRFIPKTTQSGSTIAAFNQSVEIHCSGMDESAPEKLNGMYIGGGHGVTSYVVTVASHDKTQVDIGSIWSDGTSNWVLTYIESATKLVFVRRYTGTLTKWVFSSAAPGSATFTHVSGATHTASVAFSAPTLGQFVPVLRKYVPKLSVDETTVTAEGNYRGASIVVNEIYSILNPASQQDYLIANVGSASPNYVADAIAEQVRVYNEYSWNAFGAMSVRSARSAKQPYARSAGAMGDYWGAIQMQRLSLVGDVPAGPASSIALYVPDVAPVGGYDFKNIADITANNALVLLSKSDCTNPADPASHFCQVAKSSEGSVLSSHVYGYSRTEALGLPAQRSAAVNTVLYFSSAEKQYPVAIDWAAGDAVEDETRVVTAFRAPFLPTDSTLTIPGVIVSMSGQDFCYVTSHTNLTRKAVALPARFNGLPVTILKGTGTYTLHSPYVANGEIIVSVTGGYADLVIKLG